jgi:hypothetical protein
MSEATRAQEKSTAAIVRAAVYNGTIKDLLWGKIGSSMSAQNKSTKSDNNRTLNMKEDDIDTLPEQYQILLRRRNEMKLKLKDNDNNKEKKSRLKKVKPETDEDVEIPSITKKVNFEDTSKVSWNQLKADFNFMSVFLLSDGSSTEKYPQSNDRL